MIIIKGVNKLLLRIRKLSMWSKMMKAIMIVRTILRAIIIIKVIKVL
jgi:hypothetical protein